MADYEVPFEIKKLVEKFENNKHHYTSSNFDEENTKIEFINPFFEALGWDVTNKSQSAPQYKEVVFEDTIHISGKAKAPDYSFRLGGQRIFFVEAKKPSVNIDKDKSPAYQIRRYGWSARLPLCILTDFEELAIYETTTKPSKNQDASIGRIRYYKYTEYVEKWDEIASIFSKEAVKKGDFDNFANGQKGIKKGTSKVDTEFLKEIERWRLLLARNIALRNKDLTIEELNFAVQLTIDRIIFLRMAEDRGIERYGQLKKLLKLASKNKKENNIYNGFIEICKKADAKYNSGLFHFTEEKGINLDEDSITPSLKIDDLVFKDILEPMYYPDCPYEFSVLSTEVLGNVYEQFLGKIIRLTPSHQAKVEDKPEVKKAGGVFYTPQYIVEYIVENTIGKLIKNKTPNQVAKMRFVDPACGSGSFLLGAYQYLLDWHLDYYSNLERPPKKVIIKDKDGGYKELSQEVIYTGKDGIPRLTINEKKRIVLNNIYGVDIDSQAVEVTKLSLLLKVLEDQNKDVVEQQQKLFQERALPYLGDNIKCGNSLIGTDILEQGDLSDEEIFNINPFDWEEEFEEVFENGGFDAVIGNPPYIRIQLLKKDKSSVKYYKDKYVSSVGSYDIYSLFVEKALKLTNEGDIGFILPNKFILANYGAGLRDLIQQTSSLKKLINFKDNQIFSTASTYTCLLFLSKNSKSFKYAEIEDFNDYQAMFENIDRNKEYDDGNLSVGILSSKKYIEGDWKFYIGNSASLINKLSNMDPKLKDFTEKIFVGLQTSADKAYILTLVEEKGELLELRSPQTNETHLFEKEIVKKYIKGKEIKRYSFDYQNKYIIFPYNLKDDSYELIDKKTMQNKFPYCWDYLKKVEKILRKRENNKMNNKEWWAFTYPRSMLDYRNPKIMTPNSAFNSSFTFDSEGTYYITVGVAGGYAIKLKDDSHLHELYLLAILNSSLMDLFNKKTGTSLRGKYYSFNGNIIGNYPIKDISVNNQKPFVELSKKMLDLNEQLRICKTPKEKRLLEKQIAITDKKINQLVYKLYELTSEEIAIVENSRH